MNLLARTAVALRQLAGPDAVFTGVVLLALLAVEVVGRHASTDLHDLLAASFLALLALVVFARHRQRPLPWVAAIYQSLGGLLQRARAYGFQIGLDLRGNPPVKWGVPPGVVGFTAVLATGLAVLSCIYPHCPAGCRAALASVCYTAYLIGVVGLWLALIAAVLLAAFIPLAMIHDYCIARSHKRLTAARREAWFSIGYVTTLALAALLLPLWVAPALVVAMWATYVAAATTGGRDAVRFVWRPAGTIRARSMAWSDWVVREYTVLALVVVNLTLLTCGQRLFRPTPIDAMPLTTFLGVTLAWMSPGFLGMLLAQTVAGRINDPARPARPVARVVPPKAGELSVGEIRRAFRRHGWSVRIAPAPAKPLDVGVVLVSQPDPLPRGEVWPLAVRPTDLWKGDLFARLARRDELQKRRKFAAGLEKLFKYRAGQRGRGHGIWLAPHWWFIPSLMRDGKADDDEFDYGRDAILSMAIGPPFTAVFAREVRHQWFVMLRALRIDLIFVEDGVSYRRFRRVARALYEKYDAHRGREPIEESDFRGLPGTRVLLHDYQFDEPFQSNTYPEPAYDHLGRARILHVFRDRGGDEELIEPPFDRSWRPEPVGVA